MSGALEIKDRNSNVRLTLNAQGAANIATLSPISVTGTVTTIPGTSPTFIGVYAFSVVDAPGVVAANNYMSIFNPLLSGKNIYLLGGSISSYVVGGSSATKNSMQIQRITTATAGTLQAASAVCKFNSLSIDPGAEIRTANPTVTLGANFAVAPAPAQPSTGTPVYVIEPPAGTGSFILAPGEGIVVRTAAGDTDENWNINVVWGEALVA